MKVLITGGAGFLGQLLAKQLLARGHLTDSSGSDHSITELILLDIQAGNDFSDPRVKVVTGNISDKATLEKMITPDVGSIFHLAAIVSGQAEADFDLGMAINLDASRILLDRCRALGHRPKVIFTSSVAVYGGDLPEVVQDSTALLPKSSYGTQKAIAELLLNDYTRKGFVDGRGLRLPTICIRPGKPNQAASSFVSGIIREPLNGEKSVCPVNPALRVWISSPERAVESFIHAHELPSSQFEQGGAINLPGISVTIAQMIDALKNVAGQEVADRIAMEPNPAIERIVQSWPGSWNDERAKKMGFKTDANFEEIINNYIAAHLK